MARCYSDACEAPPSRCTVGGLRRLREGSGVLQPAAKNTERRLQIPGSSCRRRDQESSRENTPLRRHGRLLSRPQDATKRQSDPDPRRLQDRQSCLPQDRTPSHWNIRVNTTPLLLPHTQFSNPPPFPQLGNVHNRPPPLRPVQPPHPLRLRPCCLPKPHLPHPLTRQPRLLPPRFHPRSPLPLPMHRLVRGDRGLGPPRGERVGRFLWGVSEQCRDAGDRGAVCASAGQ